jgi:glycosyltransferase involved in cell wall biosynthesis
MALGSDSISVLHYGSFNTLGGVEQMLATLLGDPALPIRHHLLLRAPGIHPFIRELVESRAASVASIKHLGGVRLPAWPRALRLAQAARYARACRPDLVLAWNTFGDEYLTRIELGAPVVYYEHSAAWYPRQRSDPRRFLAGVDAVLACSHAARRVLELHWGWSGRAQVCANALRGDMQPSAGGGRPAPRGRTLRLGVAARLVPLKGVALAVHALERLRRAGEDCELVVAGQGSERASLEREVARLGLGQHVRFLGLVQDMAAFYREVDLLLCPSVTELAGLTVLEAASQGCPALVSRVDGLPESLGPVALGPDSLGPEPLGEGAVGRSLAPTLPLERYAEFGAGTVGLPRFVYDPGADACVAPRLLDPDTLAEAVAVLRSDAARYERWSAAGPAHVRAESSSAAYGRRLCAALQELARPRSGAGRAP